MPRGIRLRSKMRWKNGRWRLATPDRIALEDVIVPGMLARDDVRRVLDIGVAWYTRSYPKLFAGVDYWTVDYDPASEKIASRQHHTVSATQLDTVFDAGMFDLIVCNGVVGWGLNKPEDVATGVNAMATVLRPGGWLVLGWNDMEGRRVAGLDALLAERFERAVFPPVGADHLIPDTPYAHRFDFFVRK
ncbi:methyltransferase domain-containing protein [Microbacterium sp. CJ88]|uniref:methyltransferase domain-containing protein n=1 Tax=Microbacterium sp. CJ88 TaxID=3445672 RepID=UPI003F658A07